MSDPASPASSSRLRVFAVDALVALLSATLMWLSLAPIGQFYLAWIGLAPLLWRIGSCGSGWRAAAISYLGGVFYFLLGFHWLAGATPGGYGVCAIYLSLYWGIAGAITQKLSRLPGTLSIALIAMAWAGCEYLRGTIMGGFPWLNFGHSQSPLLWICQIADVTGVAGVTFWVVLVNVAIARLMIGCPGAMYSSTRASSPHVVFSAGREYTPRGTLPIHTFVLALTLLLLIYGYWRINTTRDHEDSIPIALVQSNHVHSRQGEKKVGQQAEIDYLLNHSRDITGAAIIAWPETTMPPLNTEARTEPGLGGAPLFNRTLSQLSDLARNRDAAIVTGGYFVGGFKGEIGKRKATDIRNSVYMISRDGDLVGRYDKIRLVPFAEYLPFQESESFLHRLMTRFATASYAAGYRLRPSDQRTVFTQGSIRFVTPICFEDTIAPLVRRFIAPDTNGKKRADLILNISNDGWFNAAEKSLHLQIAVFRSIENRVPTARVSNTGQSAFIDSSGRIRQACPPFTESVLIGEAQTDSRLTIYTRFGEWFAWVCAFTSIGATVLLMVRPGRQASQSTRNT